MRILIVAHYASDRIGGEALIPLRIVTHLRDMGHQVWLVTHASGADELSGVPGVAGRTIFVPSLPGLAGLVGVGERLPPAPRQVLWAVTQIERQLAMAPVVRRLVGELDIDLVHQPISVSPSIPSALRRLPVPLVIGPLNGGMDLPPAFRGRDSIPGRIRKRTRRVLGAVLHTVLRGHRAAAVVLVANERTRARLPAGVRRHTRFVSDVGVDVVAPLLAEPASVVESAQNRAGPVRILYVGRLVAWKGVDLLLDACAALGAPGRPVGFELTIAGDGPSRAALTDQVAALGLAGRVTFLGWVDRADVAGLLRDCDVLVLPSLEEAGGAVLLEAMAAGRPVVAADWGGPGDLVDDECGIRVEPSGRAAYVAGLAAALRRLAADPDLRARMGAAGRARVERDYRWASIVERIAAIYAELVAGPDQGDR